LSGADPGTPPPDAKIDDRDTLWWRSPYLLGGVAIVLNIIFA
jgi:hypothetical protein